MVCLRVTERVGWIRLMSSNLNVFIHDTCSYTRNLHGSAYLTEFIGEYNGA